MHELMPEIVYQIRPHATHFLFELSRYYEIVIFTAADQSVSAYSSPDSKQYADEVLDNLDT